MKIRLDEMLVQQCLATDLDKARAMIGAGEVYVDDLQVDKAGSKHESTAKLRLKNKCRFVSRGGLKLEHGITAFSISAKDLCCLDVGASSGGFTDCLLQHGARKVFAVDVAYGQFEWKLRQDDRVVVKERFNARKLTPGDLSEKIDLAVMDVSFISISKIIPALIPLFQSSPAILALIKPQFELARQKIPAGGVITDSDLHQEAIDKIVNFTATIGLKTAGVTASPILGPKGNREFLIYLTT